MAAGIIAAITALVGLASLILDAWVKAKPEQALKALQECRQR